MFLRSLFAFQFLPPGQPLNLLSEATTKAALENINSPSPSHSADGCASLETFLEAGNPSNLQCLEMPPSPIPGCTQVHNLAQTPSRRHQCCPPSLAGACRAALSRQLGCGLLFFSEEEGWPLWVTARPCHMAGRWEDGWQPAVVPGPGTASGSTAWELRSSTVSLAHRPPFLLHRALNDGAEIVQ